MFSHVGSLSGVVEGRSSSGSCGGSLGGMGLQGY